jgi:foldase protein PrsA
MAKEKKNKNDSLTKNEKEKQRDRKSIDALKAIDDNRIPIILFVVGFLIATLLFRCILWPDRIATLKDGTQPIVTMKDGVITADDLYASMKSYYSIKALLNDIDDKILTKKYPSNDDMESSILKTANYYFEVYEKNAGYTKEQFLSEYGFATEKDFIDSLRLDYRRNKYYEDYVLSLINDSDVEKYYESKVFGDVDSKHILVSVSEDGLSDDEAKALAKEIIKKLNDGTSWDDVVTEYKDKITHEELGYKAFNASLESAYLEECKNLEVDSYSETPVRTSYGYHIVYKIDQKDKPELDTVKDDIKDILAKEKKDADSNLYYKALIKMREEAEVEFVDSKFIDAYKKYVSSYK